MRSEATLDDAVRELIVTLDVAKKNIVKVEEVEASGQRHMLADNDFADLVGEDEEETLVAALEEAYAAGAEDALEDDETQAGDGGVRTRRMILWEAAARQDLRRSVRRLILSRALRRVSTPPTPEKTTQNARKGAYNAKRSTTQQKRA
jgi:hypothetical protein